MSKKNSNNYWWLLISSLLMIALGVYVLFHPQETILAFALYIGVVFIFSGMVYMAISMFNKNPWSILYGLLNILLGVILVTNLGLSVASIPFIAVFWAMFIGIIQISTAYNYREYKKYSIFYGISGIVSIVFAFVVLLYPVVAILTITTMIGLYMVIYGIFGIVERSFLKKIS